MLTVNATVLKSSGSWINVSWSGVSDPKKSDWIGVYSPPIDSTIDPSYNAPVKYQVSSYLDVSVLVFLSETSRSTTTLDPQPFLHIYIMFTNPIVDLNQSFYHLKPVSAFLT